MDSYSEIMANLKPGAVSKYCVNKNKRVTFRQLIHYTPKAQKVIFSIITSNIKNLISKNPGLAKSLTNTEIPDSVTTKLTCTWLYYANLWNENTFISAGLWKYVSAWTTRVVSWIMKMFQHEPIEWSNIHVTTNC